MRVVLLEFIDEAKALLAGRGKDFFLAKETLTVCLHPKVRAFLKEQGIESKDTIDYLSNDAQHRIILKSEAVTLRLVDQLKLEDGLGISQGYREFGIHHLRLYLNHFFWVLEILQSIKEKHQVDEIHAGLSEDHSQAEMNYNKAYIRNNERFLGLFAGDFCRVHNIRFIPTEIQFKQSGFMSRLHLAVVRFLSLLVARADYAFQSRALRQDDKAVVVPALSYRMDLLLKDIRKSQPKVKCFMIWEGSSTVDQEMYKAYLILNNWKRKFAKKNLLEAVFHLDLLKGAYKKDKGQQKDFAEAFDRLDQWMAAGFKENGMYHGVSFVKYLREKINRGLRPATLDLQHSTAALNEVFKKLKPALLMSMYSSGIYYMMGEVANRLGFPALNISHGTHVPPNNQFEEIENYRLATSVISNTYPHVAVQTPWAAKFLDHYKDSRKRIETGPLLYSVITDKDRQELRKEILGDNSKAKIVVHAATQKGRHGMRFHITESLDEYIATLAEIAKTVNQLDNVYFVIRPHPACDLTEEEFRRLLPACPRMVVVNQGSFSRVLSAADMVISYSSTCIEEAVQNGIPVILFDQWNRYNHFNLQEVTSVSEIRFHPAYYVVKPAVLAPSIAKIFGLSTHNSLDAQELIYYKYAHHYKSNFIGFVNYALEGKTP